MASLRQIQKIWAYYAIPAAIALSGCSSPTSDDRTSWSVTYSIPLINETFSCVELMAGDSSASVQLDHDSMRLGDTLYYSLTDTFDQTHVHHLVTIPETLLCTQTGIPVIRNLKPLQLSFPVPEYAAPGNELPETVGFTVRESAFVNEIDSVVFDTCSGPVMVDIENRSSGTIFSAISGTVFSTNTPLARLDTIYNLRPGETIRRELDVRGKHMGPGTRTELDIDIAGGSLYNPGSELVVTLDINGTTLSEASLMDSILQRTFKFDVPVPFGEPGFKVWYVDIANLELPFRIKNGTPVGLSVTAGVDHLWDMAYCRSNNLNNFDDLENGALDSGAYKGNEALSIDLPLKEAAENAEYRPCALELSNVRLFGRWDSQYGCSMASLALECRLGHSGKYVAITKETSFGLELCNARICFSRIAGCYMEQKKIEGNQELIRVSPDNLSSVFPQIRGRLKLDHTDVTLNMHYLFPAGTAFDEMSYMSIFSQAGGRYQGDTVSWSFPNIRRDSSFCTGFNLKNLINTFPDSLGYKVDCFFAPQKAIVFDHGTLICDTNRASIEIKTRAVMNVYLYAVWAVEDTIKMVIEQGSEGFALTGAQVRAIKNKYLSANLDIENHTSLTGYLFFAAFTGPRPGPSSGNDSLIIQDLARVQNAGDIVLLSAPEGISLPSRGSCSDNTIKITEKDMNTFTSSDSFFYRLELIFPPSPVAVLSDTDYIQITGSISLEGTQMTSDIF
ncbi:MAG: hypothetical protein GF350_04495 [Chitinivibrionales bacterium]|nr:hypothetical protein [Chitinivibrionales bacterium]